MEKGRVSDEAVKKATGKIWSEWFAILDKAGAKKMSHTDVAHLLSTEYIKSGWWAQMVTVEYERVHGKRALNQRVGGSYNVTAHRTAEMPLPKLYKSWLKAVQSNPGLKRKKLEATTVHPEKSIRYKCGDERINVAFVALNQAKSRIGIDHERLPTKESVEVNRLFWKKILAAL
jgi:hypothetical protein